MIRKLGAILMTLIALAFTLPSNAFADADGFRGLKWGTDFSSVKDSMRYVRTDPSYGGIKMYSRENDELTIGAAELESIEYGFWQDKLSNVWIRFNGSVNFLSLKAATVEKFGDGDKPNRFMEYYVWRGWNTQIVLDYKDVSEEGRLTMQSQEISSKQKSFADKKAKKGAETGF